MTRNHGSSRAGRIRLDLVIAIALFVVALTPRVLALDAFVTWDEPDWVFRSARFMEALAEARWADTVQGGHPGVTTMWAGTLGLSLNSTADANERRALAAVISAAGLDVQDTDTLRVLGGFLPTARIPVAILTALSVVGFYSLARRLFGLGTALLAALLLALDPFFLAHSRLLHVDALAASFMILSLLSTLAFLVDGRRVRDALLSGVCAGLAVLTKSPAAFIAPFTLLLVGTWWLAGAVRSRRGVHNGVGGAPALFPWRDLLGWGLAAGLAVVVIWPAMWTDPLRAVQAVTGTATRHASTPHINSFWFGQVVRDPGLPFYLLSLAFRLTPVTGLGFLVVLPLLRQPGKRRSLLIGILSYLVLFVLVMSMAAKKFDRYILACFPAIDLLAALGIVGLLRGLARWRQLRLRTARLVVVCGAALVVLAQAAGTLPHHPYYLTYYNPLLGGGQRAVQTITVGWGEGVDQAVRYVNDKASASALRVATWGVAGVAPLFRGSTYVLDQRSEMLADYVILNVSDVQFGSPHTFEFYGQVEAEHVVRLHGVEYAWVYRNERYVETLGALEGLVGEQELVVFGGESKLSEEWPSERPSLVLDPKGDEADIAAALNEAAQPEGRVWLVEFAAERDEPDLARFQLDTHALREAEHMLPPMTVSSYRVLPETVFAPLLVESSPEVVFAGRLSLLGLALGDTELMASQSLGVVLRWQVTDAIDGDYTVFVHLLDRYEQRLSQHDELLVDGGGRPTSQWPPGEQHDMRFLVDIPADAVPGDYLLVAGLYRVDGDDRLWLDGMDGLQGDTAYPLAEVHIVAHPSSEE